MLTRRTCRPGRGDRRRNDPGARATGQRGCIREWPADERPREKLLRCGARTLSDTEVLAILLGSGPGASSAIDVARSLLTAAGGIRSLGERNSSELMRVKGVGAAKAVAVLAALELGRRVQVSDGNERVVVRSPDDVARRMIPLLRDRRTEAFILLVLQTDNSLKAEIELTSGTLNASLVHPREVYKAAIDHSAASIIVVHNHPSGNPEPSAEDLAITRQLSEAGTIVGIPLRDHVIIAGSGYTSLADRGIL